MKVFKVSNFLFKVISRSWFLFLGILFTVFFLTSTYVNYVTNQNLGYINYIKTQEFSLLSLALSCSASIIFGLKLKDESINYLISNKFNYFMSALIASIKLGVYICLIPLSYILMYIFTHKGITMPYIINGLIEFTFTYILCIICTSMLTTIICFLFEKTIIRVITSSIMILITSSFNNTFFTSNKFIMAILNILNVHEDFDYSLFNNFLGFNHDIRYILDKLIMLFILLIILLIISIKFYKNTKYLKFIKSFILVFTILTISSFIILYNSFTLVDNTEIFSYNNKIHQDISIEEYKMNLNFGYKLKNEATIKIKNNSENKIKEISFLLDNIFNVNNIKLNDKNLKFTHENNKLNITLDNHLEKNSTVNLQINYSGRVNHIDSVGNQYLIANANSILLPIDSLAWYPSIKQDKDIKFDLNLNSKLKIKSNLNLDAKKNTLSGNSNSVFLIAGNLQTVNIDGYEISFPLDTNINELYTSLNFLKNDIKSLNLTESEKVQINNRKKILFSPIQYATNSMIQVVDGTIVYII